MNTIGDYLDTHVTLGALLCKATLLNHCLLPETSQSDAKHVIFSNRRLEEIAERDCSVAEFHNPLLLKGHIAFYQMKNGVVPENIGTRFPKMEQAIMIRTNSNPGYNYRALCQPGFFIKYITLCFVDVSLNIKMDVPVKNEQCNHLGELIVRLHQNIFARYLIDPTWDEKGLLKILLPSYEFTYCEVRDFEEHYEFTCLQSVGYNEFQRELNRNNMRDSPHLDEYFRRKRACQFPNLSSWTLRLTDFDYFSEPLPE